MKYQVSKGECIHDLLWNLFYCFENISNDRIWATEYKNHIKIIKLLSSANTYHLKTNPLKSIVILAFLFASNLPVQMPFTSAFACLLLVHLHATYAKHLTYKEIQFNSLLHSTNLLMHKSFSNRYFRVSFVYIHIFLLYIFIIYFDWLLVVP